MTRTYQITLTEEQLKVLSDAANMYSRIYMGQWDAAAPMDATYQGDRGELTSALRVLGSIMTGIQQGSYGIYADEIPENAKMAFDMHRTFRHRIAWTNNPKGGFTIQYDDPSVCPASERELPLVELCSDTMPCEDCRESTSDLCEYYMVRDNLWDAYGCGSGYLCIGCLEDRVGRKLESRDFTGCNLNIACENDSDRLRDRKGKIYPLVTDSVALRNLWQDKVEDGILLCLHTQMRDHHQHMEKNVHPTPNGLKVHGEDKYLPLRDEE